MLLKKKLQKLIEEDFKLIYCKTYFFFFFDACFVPSIYYSVKERKQVAILDLPKISESRPNRIFVPSTSRLSL